MSLNTSSKLLSHKKGIIPPVVLSFLLFTILVQPFKALSQIPSETNAEAEKARIMILGTPHFGNPGQDVINTTFPDVLKPEYQRQINNVLDSLSQFNPTKIGLEARPSHKEEFDSTYHAYLDENHQLTRNERQQIGFQLAKRFGHPRVYSIDHAGEFPFKSVLEYARENDPGYMNYFSRIRETIKSTYSQLYSASTIPEILRYHNGRENLAMQRNFYAQTAPVGNDSTWAGVNLVSKWHRRNIKIFAHLSRIAEPGDRVIVIFGSGHAPLLRYFVESSQDMILVDPLEYL